MLMILVSRLAVVMILFFWLGQGQGQGQGQGGQGQGQTRDQFRKALLAAVRADDTLDESDVDDYVEFSAKFDRFGRFFNPGDFRRRYSLFRETKRNVEKWNREAGARTKTNHGRDFRETYGLTEFADLTPEEKRARFSDPASLPEDDDANANENANENAPGLARQDGAPRRRLVTAGCNAVAGDFFAVIDNTNSARDLFCGSATKNQGQTGSCWLFANTQTFECNYQQSEGVLKSFSEQQAIDCSRSCCEGSKASGGWAYKETAWIAQKGLCGSYNTPWDTTTDRDNYCYCNEQKKKGYCYEFEATNGDQLTKGAQSYAWSFGMYVDDKFLSLLGSGSTFRSCDTQSYGHAMSIVGQWYGDYVWVKNSLGTDWGDNGYVWIATSAIFGSCHKDTTIFTMNYGFSDAGTSMMPGLIEQPVRPAPYLPAAPVYGPVRPDAVAVAEHYKPWYKPNAVGPDPRPRAGPVDEPILFSLSDLFAVLAVGICLASLVYNLFLCNKLKQTRHRETYRIVKSNRSDTDSEV